MSFLRDMSQLKTWSTSRSPLPDLSVFASALVFAFAATTTEALSQGTWEPNTSRGGSIYETHRPPAVKSAEQCRTLCSKNTAKCAAWTFNTSSGNCHLKHRVPGAKASKVHISGVMADARSCSWSLVTEQGDGLIVTFNLHSSVFHRGSRVAPYQPDKINIAGTATNKHKKSTYGKFMKGAVQRGHLAPSAKPTEFLVVIRWDNGEVGEYLGAIDGRGMINNGDTRALTGPARAKFRSLNGLGTGQSSCNWGWPVINAGGAVVSPGTPTPPPTPVRCVDDCSHCRRENLRCEMSSECVHKNSRTTHGCYR